VGDSRPDEQARPRHRRRWLGLGSIGAAAVVLAAGAWVDGPSPSAVALEPTPPVAGVPSGVPASARDVHAALFVDRLSAVAGRSLTTLAAQVAGPVANPLESEASTVAGAAAASQQYAETLAQLSEAEEAAAAQLAQTEQEVQAAEADRAKAAQDLAAEEAAAAEQVDAAIDAAIAAARAQSSGAIDDYAFGGIGGTIPSGASTSTAEVLQLVRKVFPADQVGNAMAVSRCESGHANRVSKPNANGSRDFGVFQVNDGGTLQAALRSIGVRFTDISDARAKALDPAINVRMARAIWDSRGWQPWVCAAKLKIVAGLYQRTPGPMDGKYDDYGRAL
jgi:hypothetical protein